MHLPLFAGACALALQVPTVLAFRPSNFAAAASHAAGVIAAWFEVVCCSLQLQVTGGHLSRVFNNRCDLAAQHSQRTMPQSRHIEHRVTYALMLQAVAGWHSFMNAAVGGAALLSVMLAVVSPAQANPFFQNTKPPLQEMKVRQHMLCCTMLSLSTCGCEADRECRSVLDTTRSFSVILTFLY